MFSIYLNVTFVLFGVWFCLFLLDATTPKNHLLSWAILLIAPWFWPIVLPLSADELLSKARKKTYMETEAEILLDKI